MLDSSHLTRQLDIIPLNTLKMPIHIVGAGAIGSFTALMLAKMGMEDITVYDNDMVSIENMNNQFYRFSDIGKPKVTALAELVNDFTGVRIKPFNGRWEKEKPSELRGIVISAADSMQVRKDLFEHCMADFRINWFLDSRMGSESALMYVMNPQRERDQVSYLKTTYSDADAAQERCTAKSTIYTANMLSGHVVKAVKDLITKGSYARVTMWSIANNQQQCHPGEQ